MKQNESGAFILSETKNGERIVSCGGRISTKPGSAIMLYKKATDKQKNLNLINKVISSGHKTILEHHYINIAFNNVSIFVEQYLINFRLASFTIKSGRYVNFSNAGFNLNNEFNQEQQNIIKKHFKKMFKFYDLFVANGIPTEDARFILPYGLKTNIYMSCNVRELIHIVCTMIYGDGKNYREIYALGLSLKQQLEERYPNIIEQNKNNYTSCNLNDEPTIANKKINYVNHTVQLLAHPNNPSLTINEIARTSGYNNFNFKTSLNNNNMAKLLENFSYTYKISNFALIILKHYCRHRMQTICTTPLVKMAQSFNFVIPDSINKNPELAELYKKCIKQNRNIYNKLVKDNINPYLLIYIAPHASAIDFVATINARELLHFCNLRCCNRAQWEINRLACKMLELAKNTDKQFFKEFGPSCFTFGVCPEGRLCCGQQQEIKYKFSK